MRVVTLSWPARVNHRVKGQRVFERRRFGYNAATDYVGKRNLDDGRRSFLIRPKCYRLADRLSNRSTVFPKAISPE